MGSGLGAEFQEGPNERIFDPWQFPWGKDAEHKGLQPTCRGCWHSCAPIWALSLSYF